jgi:molybdenum cofactor biosynthesis protein A
MAPLLALNCLRSRTPPFARRVITSSTSFSLTESCEQNASDEYRYIKAPHDYRTTAPPLSTLTRPFSESHSLCKSSRRFSTAVAADYNEDVGYEQSMSKLIQSNDENDDRMPRLHALRKQLRHEKKKQQQQQHQQRKQHVSAQLPERIQPVIDYSTHTDNNNILTDTHGRHHNYLRISLSERCNLRCQYCMPPEGVPLSPPSNLLTNDEIMRLVTLFARNGVDKVRLTGGEPLLRKDLVPLVHSISEELQKSNATSSNLVGITTNGISLSRHVHELVDAGLTGINISLDTLQGDRFQEITRRNGLDKVMRAIGDSVSAFQNRYGHVRTGPNGTGGSRVKINCVVMKNFNDDEMVDFVSMATDTFGGDVDMRFIEWMPFNDNAWSRSRFVSYQDMMDKITNGGLPLERMVDGPNDTTKWWKAPTKSDSTRIGFITSMSEHFCSTCNRLRITADGKIKVCLFGSNEKEVSLKDIMRQGQNNDPRQQEEDLSRVIHAAVQRKTFSLGGHGSAENIAKAANNRPMTLIGG